LKLIFLFLLVTGLAIADSAVPDPAQSLLEADRAFGKATAEHGLEGWMAYFAEDACIFPDQGPVVKGLDAIRRHYSSTGFNPKNLSWTPLHAELSTSGDLGYTYGTWTLPFQKEDGTSGTAEGKYLTVWRKDKNGDWKVVADIGNAGSNSETETH